MATARATDRLEKSMFAQRTHDRRRFLGMAALSLAAAWIGTRDSVLRLISDEPFRVPARVTWRRSAGRRPGSIRRP